MLHSQLENENLIENIWSYNRLGYKKLSFFAFEDAKSLFLSYLSKFDENTVTGKELISQHEEIKQLINSEHYSPNSNENLKLIYESNGYSSLFREMHEPYYKSVDWESLSDKDFVLCFRLLNLAQFIDSNLYLAGFICSNSNIETLGIKKFYEKILKIDPSKKTKHCGPGIIPTLISIFLCVLLESLDDVLIRNLNFNESLIIDSMKALENSIRQKWQESLDSKISEEKLSIYENFSSIVKDNSNSPLN